MEEFRQHHQMMIIPRYPHLMLPKLPLHRAPSTTVIIVHHPHPIFLWNHLPRSGRIASSPTYIYLSTYHTGVRINPTNTRPRTSCTLASSTACELSHKLHRYSNIAFALAPYHMAGLDGI